MSQKTLVLIKQDGVERNLIGQIISYYEKGGLKVVKIEGPLMADEEIVRKHYSVDDYDYILTLGHVDVTGWTEEQKKEKYDKSLKIVEELQKAIQSGPIVKIIFEGEDAVAKVREITGKTDPAKSPAGSVRGDLGDDSFEKCDKEGRAVRNLVHASGTPEEADREIKLWFGEL